MQHTCEICGDPAVEGSEYCKSHNRANSQLQWALGKWQLAYGNGVDRRSILKRLLRLSGTGQKVREVATLLLEKDSS